MHRNFPDNDGSNIEVKLQHMLDGFRVRKHGSVYLANAKHIYEERQDYKKSRFKSFSKHGFWWASVMISAAALAYNAYTTGQATSTRKQIEVAFLKDIYINYSEIEHPPDVGDYTVIQGWKNLGRTPAKHVHYDWVWDFVPPSKSSKKIEVEDGSDYIPADYEFTMSKTLSTKTFSEAIEGKPLYFWGQLNFEDTFTDGMFANSTAHGHLYRYCAVAKRIVPSDKDSWDMSPCEEKYQCIDQSCPDYKDQLAKMR